MKSSNLHHAGFRLLAMKLLSERLEHVYRLRPELEGERGQTGLRRASGATKSVVNQWLVDKIKSIDIRYALNIEKALGINHIWLMTGEGEPELKSPGLSSAESDLLQAFRAASDAERDLFESIARSVRRRLLAESSVNKA